MSTDKISHIVMADDDEEDFIFFRSAIEKICGDSIKISHAFNWIDLLSYLNKATLPDVIFLDLNMPIKTGLECLQLIRADSRYDSIGVVIYSTSSTSKEIDETYNAGANYYIVKPDTVEQINRIAEIICHMDKEQLLRTPEKSKYRINS